MLPAFTSLGSDLPAIHAHSDLVDSHLGFDIPAIERRLFQEAYRRDPEGDMTSWGRMMHEGSQTWVGLQHHALLTPYHELNRIIDILDPKEGHHFVDLGAGYGRMGLVLNERCPSAHFTGIECVKERVDEGNRVFSLNDCTRARLMLGNLFAKDFSLPMGDTYMIYDYGNIEHIRWTMGQLQNLAGIHRFHVVARGQGIRALIQYAHPWLADMGTPVHEEHFSVYRNYEN